MSHVCVSLLAACHAWTRSLLEAGLPEIGALSRVGQRLLPTEPENLC